MIRRHRRLLPLALAIGLVAAGCGSDSSGDTTSTPAVSIPAVTAPGISATASQATTVTIGPTTSTKTFNPKAPDSATNDVPPKPGSPQSAFEKQCKQNPSACG